MTDVQFLRWLRARLINVYNESPNVDFVQRLKSIADRLELEDATPILTPPPKNTLLRSIRGLLYNKG